MLVSFDTSVSSTIEMYTVISTVVWIVKSLHKCLNLFRRRLEKRGSHSLAIHPHLPTT